MGFGNSSCHDTDVFEELHLIAVACSGGGGASLIDASDFKNQKVLWTYTYPGLNTALGRVQLGRALRLRER